MGRPVRRVDAAFAADVSQFVIDAGSMRAAANLLNVVPTTLARSLAGKGFAEGTRQKIENRMPIARRKMEQLRSAVSPRELPSQHVLHLLQKLSMLLPDAIRELEAASVPPDSPARVLEEEQ